MTKVLLNDVKEAKNFIDVVDKRDDLFFREWIRQLLDERSVDA